MKLVKPLLICAILILSSALSGCGAGTTAFRADIDFPITNLDPQFATAREAQIIIAAMFEGLVVQQPTGEIIPGVAKSWEISSDGLIYTFHLREGLYWSGAQSIPLTAEDFAFALSRMFNPGTPSPHAGYFSAIRNAERRLSGDRAAHLGLRTVNRYTLQITLERPDPMFLTRLASPAAMPVNEEFFTSTRGRYGLETRFVIANGPFVLRTWSDGMIHLIRNERYHSPENIPNTATFHIGREEPYITLTEGRSDFARVPDSFAQTALESNLAMNPHGYRIWCIMFNMRDPVWGQALLRQSIAASVVRQSYGYFPTAMLATESFLLGEQRVFELYPFVNPLTHNTQNALELLELGMEAAQLTEPPPLTILVPGWGEHMPYMREIQQIWQETLPISVHLEIVSGESLERRLLTGEFQAALVPFESQAMQLDEMLEQFRSASPINRTGYRNPIFDMFLDQARLAPTITDMAARYGEAHRLLLSDAPIIPLYFEITWYAVTQDAYPHAWIYLGGRRAIDS